MSHAAWGYFFLYFDVNLGPLNVLPDWAAYLLFLSAIGKLRGEQRDFLLYTEIKRFFIGKGQGAGLDSKLHDVFLISLKFLSGAGFPGAPAAFYFLPILYHNDTCSFKQFAKISLKKFEKKVFTSSCACAMMKLTGEMVMRYLRRFKMPAKRAPDERRTEQCFV